MIKIKIGEIIKELRNKKGISARELSRRSGISQPYLSQLETGKNNNPTNEVLKKIASGLSIEFVELIHLSNYYNAEEVEKNKINKLLSEMTDLKGYFLPHLKEDVFYAIRESNLYMAHAFHNASDASGYERMFTDYFLNKNDEWTYSERDHEDMAKDFDKAYNIRTMLEVIEQGETTIEELESFSNLLNDIANKHNIAITGNEEVEADLYKVIKHKNVHYKQNKLNDNDKIIIAAYLDGYFSNEGNN
ncbi:Helix-turn-helix [Amphibacillus marinus]|uniref:Helix-turn-helix n=1 Tax=Amphibacillus marinus TaxID=872970 RepID=A0A1H8K295_9BACI|nr:helix-turn-helix transcriptional regulator [Amphibacillus marinus]SEN87062.1 Helix-turn-helix [Amphibacillus marinus]